MQSIEKRAIFSLAAIVALRLWGLMMVLPVLALYTAHFKYANPFLIGIALGMYGLTQALFQLPLGMASDYIGRKPVMTLGFILLTLGSLLCAISHHIVGLIVGRALQGACAISSTLSATLADLVQDKHRIRGMAIIGVCISIVFSLSMVAGSILNAWVGIRGLFWITALLALLGILILHTWVPTPTHQVPHKRLPARGQLKDILCHPILWRINMSIAIQHAIFIANFTALPPLLEHIARLPSDQLWQLYLPTTFAAFIVMIPLIRLTEKCQQFKRVLLIGASALLLSELLLWLQHSQLIYIFLSLFIFFTTFSVLEAALPSLASQEAPLGYKGTVMGFYSTSQFLGMFVGGFLGGATQHYFSGPSVFLFCSLLNLFWLFSLYSLPIDRKAIEKSSKSV